MSSTKTVYSVESEAVEFAALKNGEPLPAGKEKRTPFKVYVVKNETGTVYSVAQAPQAAVYAASFDLGISAELLGGKPMKTVEEYLAGLSPDQLAAARQFLGA